MLADEIVAKKLFEKIWGKECRILTSVFTERYYYCINCGSNWKVISRYINETEIDFYIHFIKGISLAGKFISLNPQQTTILNIRKEIVYSLEDIILEEVMHHF